MYAIRSYYDAVAKLLGEYYCSVFHEVYGMETFSLRYFNVFGPRQNPSSFYSGVISRFIDALMSGNRITSYNVCYTKLLRPVHVARRMRRLHGGYDAQLRKSRYVLGSQRLRVFYAVPPGVVRVLAKQVFIGVQHDPVAAVADRVDLV